MSARRPRRNLLLALALLLTGCAGLLAPPPEPLAPEVQHLLDALHRRWQQFQDLRTQVEITLQQGDQAQHLAGVLLLRSPDSIRVEVLSPWGQPVVLLVAATGTFTLYHVTESRAVVGPTSARAAERWLGLALEPSELVGILAGHVLPVREPRSGAIRPVDEFGPSLELAGPRGLQRIWLDRETLVVRQVEWTGGSTRVRILYDGGGPVDPPAALTFMALDQSLTVSLRYREPQVGVGLPRELFQLTLPEHVKIQRFR